MNLFVSSGYDFGYLIKLLTDTNLPQDESDFFELLRLYFPVVYDVKVILFFSYLTVTWPNMEQMVAEFAESCYQKKTEGTDNPFLKWFHCNESFGKIWLLNTNRGWFATFFKIIYFSYIYSDLSMQVF